MKILTHLFEIYSFFSNMDIKLKRNSIDAFVEASKNANNPNNTINTNDVSFSIPDWKYQELKSFHAQYEK